MVVKNYDINSSIRKTTMGADGIWFFITVLSLLGTFHNGQATFLCFDFNLSIDGSVTNIVEGSIPILLPLKGFYT